MEERRGGEKRPDRGSVNSCSSDASIELPGQLGEVGGLQSSCRGAERTRVFFSLCHILECW